MTRRDPEVSLEAVVTRIDAIAPGSTAPDTVPSGFPSLDRMLGGGFRRQDLVVLGGDVGSGSPRSRWPWRSGPRRPACPRSTSRAR